MESTIKFNKKRKFHDAWAYILYLSVSMGSTTYALLSIKRKDKAFDFTFNHLKTLVSSSNIDDSKIITCSSILVGIFLFIQFFCLRYFPEFFLKCIVTLFPLVLFAMLFVTKFNIYVLKFSFFATLFWAFFVHKSWKNISLISPIIKTAVNILILRFFSVTTGVLISFLLLCLNIIISRICIILEIDNKRIILTMLFLNFSWSFTNVFYFFKVYITSIIAFHIEAKNNAYLDLFLSSIKNSIFSLGSIAFAGLLISILETFKFLNNFFKFSYAINEYNNLQQNLMNRILYCIDSNVINSVKSFVKMINEFTVPYIAIHGTSYKESIKNSFKLIQKYDINPLTGTFVLNFMILIMCIIISMVCLIVSRFIININSENILNVIMLNLGPLLFYSVWTIVFSASFLSLIYLCAERPLFIQEYDKQLYDNIQLLS